MKGVVGRSLGRQDNYCTLWTNLSQATHAADTPSEVMCAYIIMHSCVQHFLLFYCSCRCTLRAAVASCKSKEDVQGSPSCKPTAATAAAPGEAEETASRSGTPQAAELTAIRTPFAQSGAASSSMVAADAAEAPASSEEEAQLNGGAARPLDGTAEEEAHSIGMRDGQVADASAGDQAATLSAAAPEVQDTRGVAAASASKPSESHTAAAAAEEGPTGAQLHSRGIIEGLLRSTAPWPDMDFERLINHAGKDLHH